MLAVVTKARSRTFILRVCFSDNVSESFNRDTLGSNPLGNWLVECQAFASKEFRDQMETNGESAGGLHSGGVGKHRKTCGVGEAHRYRKGFASDVRRARGSEVAFGERVMLPVDKTPLA